MEDAGDVTTEEEEVDDYYGSDLFVLNGAGTRSRIISFFLAE